MPRPLCVHCKTRTAWRARGLCSKCYDDDAIRNLYPPRHTHRGRYLENATAEELDALVESNRSTMPNEPHERRETCRVSPLEMRMVRWRDL